MEVMYVLKLGVKISIKILQLHECIISTQNIKPDNTKIKKKAEQTMIAFLKKSCNKIWKNGE